MIISFKAMKNSHEAQENEKSLSFVVVDVGGHANFVAKVTRDQQPTWPRHLHFKPATDRFSLTYNVGQDQGVH